MNTNIQINEKKKVTLNYTWKKMEGNKKIKEKERGIKKDKKKKKITKGLAA